jgi:type III secretion protein T
MELLEFKDWLLGLSLSVPRLLAVFGILPFFSTQVMPGLLRNGVAASLCIILVPVIKAQTAGVSLGGVELFGLMAKEVMLGLMIGFPIATVFWAVEAIGSYIDNQRGSSMASTADPLTGSDTTPLGLMFTQVFVVYLFAGGAFLMLLDLFYRSFQVWPVLEFVPNFTAAGGPLFYLDFFDRMMRTIVVMSGPVILAMFLAEFSLGLVSQFAPQLNVFVIAMPIKSALGIFALIFYLPILFAHLLEYEGGLRSIWRTAGGVLQ